MTNGGGHPPVKSDEGNKNPKPDEKKEDESK